VHRIGGRLQTFYRQRQIAQQVIVVKSAIQIKVEKVIARILIAKVYRQVVGAIAIAIAGHSRQIID